MRTVSNNKVPMPQNLSKTDFLLGVQCSKALWLKKYHPEFGAPKDDQAKRRMDVGVQIGKLAQQLFPSGVEVLYTGNVENDAEHTQALLRDGHMVLFEATFMDPESGAYARIDILAYDQEVGKWQIYEIKGSTQVKEYHIDDIAFQVFVLEKAGISLDSSSIMHVNSDYIRNGDLDLDQLFTQENVTEAIKESKKKVAATLLSLKSCLDKMDSEPSVSIGAHCKKPFDCSFTGHCWSHVPDYSVYKVFQMKKAVQNVESYGPDVKDLPEGEYPKGMKVIDIEAHLSGEVHTEKEKLKQFIDEIKYPIYFLDYETINPAIPIFDGSSSYQQIPFQFSLHIQEKPGADTTHHEFIHTDRSDPRRPFAESLIDLCGESGSVIVYNQTFEKGRNSELADLFPEYKERLLNINDRIVDLWQPFKSRWLYHPNQNGSVSIKDVLPSFTDVSYEDLEIANGGEAMLRYELFMAGEYNGDLDTLWKGLRAYCERDTWAMKVLLDKIHQRAGLRA